jgi:hypothetical protein
MVRVITDIELRAEQPSVPPGRDCPAHRACPANALLDRVDVDALLSRVDVNDLMRRVDMDTLVEQTDLGAVIARSSGGAASEALDAARSQAVGLDQFIDRWVQRALRRKHPAPSAPPALLNGRAGP